MTKAPKEPRREFGTDREARALPVLTKTIDYPHATQSGLIWRVLPTGRRVFWHRWKLKVPDGLGGFEEDSGRKEIGELAKKDKPGGITVEEAVRRVADARSEKRDAQTEGGTTNRLTVKAAWDLYPTEKRLHASSTRDKDTYNYEKYLQWFQHRYLDELPYAFGNQTLAQLEKGTLVPDVDKAQASSVGTLGPLSTATLYGIVNLGVNLYEIAHLNKGLKGMARSENPARDAKKKLGRPNVRRGRIPLAKIPKAWRAADQLVSPWWRDMFYVFVLTGLRRNLMVEMLFSDIDWDERMYVIPMLRAGTKRRRAKEGDNPLPLRLPLSKRVMSILTERRRFAPDPNGPVWYSPRPTRGKASKKQADEGRAAVLTDARASWSLIAEQLGVRFTPQDLRRTFANLGASSKAEVMSVSLLMLHSGQTLAQATGIPSITVSYFGTPEAQEKMHEAAEAIDALVMRLLSLPEAELAKVKDVALDPGIEAALKEEEKAEPIDTQDVDSGDEDSADYES